LLRELAAAEFLARSARQVGSRLQAFGPVEELVIQERAMAAARVRPVPVLPVGSAQFGRLRVRQELARQEWLAQVLACW
jgi:hypothetical protein